MADAPCPCCPNRIAWMRSNDPVFRYPGYIVVNKLKLDATCYLIELMNLKALIKPFQYSMPAFFDRAVEFPQRHDLVGCHLLNTGTKAMQHLYNHAVKLGNTAENRV